MINDGANTNAYFFNNFTKSNISCVFAHSICDITYILWVYGYEAVDLVNYVDRLIV